MKDEEAVSSDEPQSAIAHNFSESNISQNDRGFIAPIPEGFISFLLWNTQSRNSCTRLSAKQIP